MKAHPFLLLCSLVCLTCTPSSKPSVGPEPAARVNSTPVAGRENPDDGAGNAGTPGSVSCGSEQCNLSDQLCCVDGPDSYCIPRTSRCESRTNGMPRPVMECDDREDCPNDLLCCERSTDFREFACMKKCRERELCVPGATCSPGTRCRPDDDSPSGASCRPAVQQALCGSTVCEGNAPVCCWNGVAKTGTCVATAAECAPENGRKPLECGGPGDCASQVCCFDPQSGSKCAPGCHLGFAWPVCRTIQDCPAVDGARLLGCEPNAEAQLGTCGYEQYIGSE